MSKFVSTHVGVEVSHQAVNSPGVVSFWQSHPAGLFSSERPALFHGLSNCL